MAPDPRDCGQEAPIGTISALARPAHPELIAQWLRLLIEPGTVHELRALNVRDRPGGTYRRTVSGYYSDLARMATEAARLSGDGDASGVYLTLNPGDPDLLARASNKTVPAQRGGGTTDADIVRRGLLLIDLDPCRKSGISSTDAEKAHAFARVADVQTYLDGRGWPRPVLADSGNGYHLFFRLDLPNDTASTATVQTVLQALAARFNDDRTKVDTSVNNAARIVKMPGTVGRKGDHVEARPHRASTVLDAPESRDEFQVVPLELLLALASEAPRSSAKTTPRAATTGTPSGYASRLDVERWLSDQGVAFSRREGADAWTNWDIPCPFNSAHQGTDCAVMQHADGAMGAKCFHAGCAGKGWQDFRDAIGRPEAHQYDPPLSSRGPAERSGETAGGGSNRAGCSPPGPPTAPVQADAVDEAGPGGYATARLTDVGNASRLAMWHGDRLRHVHSWSKWLVWDGARWQLEAEGEVVQLAKRVTVRIFHEATQMMQAVGQEMESESKGGVM